MYGLRPPFQDLILVSSVIKNVYHTNQFHDVSFLTCVCDVSEKKIVFCFSDLWVGGGGLLRSGPKCYWTKLNCISRKKKAYSLRLLRSESYFFITNCNWGTSVASSYLPCLAPSQEQQSTTLSGSTSTAPLWTITLRKFCKFKSVLYKQPVF